MASWVQCSLVLAAVVAVLPLAGCGNGFPPQSELHGLRVLAVRPEPASGSPGATVRLKMLVADARPLVDRDDGTRGPPSDVQVAWLGGCHNPPSRQYFACAPTLRRIASDPAAALAAGLIGMGDTYDLVIPDDILSSAPRLASDPVHFGVSYAFFAACTGNLVPAEGAGDQFPFACLTDEGAPIGPSGFVIGFSTVYSYENDLNHSPVLTGLDFDSRTTLAASSDPFGEADAPELPIPCTVQTEAVDCAGAPFGHPARCSQNGVCAPFISSCSGKQCPGHRVSPHFLAASLEGAPGGGTEITWASYYSTLGTWNSDTRLVADRSNGLARDFSALWTAPPPAADGERQSARLWVTVNDQRGGATWAFFDVVVE